MATDHECHDVPMDTLGRAGCRLGAATVLFHQAVAERLGLSATDHKCLDILAAAGAVSAGRLAELTGLTTGAITGIIDRLERAGFARRQADPDDRRRIIVHPDLEAIECRITPLFSSLAAMMAELNSSYEESQRALILDYLTRCRDLLQHETIKLRAEQSQRTLQEAHGPARSERTTAP